MAKDKGKYLIPCFKDIDAYDMPKEFAKLQSQDMGKVGAVQDLLRGIDKILNMVDYITALLIHGLSWSIMIHVPLMFLGGIRDDFFLLLSVLLNTVIHAIIDNLKANKLKINLDVDQCLHGLQIVITWIIFSLISYYQ